MPNWTKDQALAINKRGGKIIVSAAAGSGKTAVLSERVIEFILNGGEVNRPLIVTFTKAAAGEMKERIKKKIEEAYLKDTKNEHLRKQINLVDTALITTMDAFYADVVKQNFEKLKIDRDFDVLSNEEEKILKEKVVNDVIEDAFDNVGDFKLLVDFFDGIEKLKANIFKVSNHLDTVPFKDEYIKKALSNYTIENDYYKDALLKNIKLKMKSYSYMYASLYEDLYNESSDFDKVLEVLNKERNYINEFLCLSDFDSLSSLIRRISFDTLRTPKGHKDDAALVKYKVIRDEFKEEIKKKLNELMFVSDSLYDEEKEKMKAILTTLFEVVSKFDKKMMEEKKRISSFSFSDIAHFVIKLLIKDGKKTPLAKSMSLKFDEILIDEYQDTNNLQNVIFNAISKDNSNLFIVGDVKQSIYRFRSACPEIFNSDKNSASKDGFPNLITLSKNFRSRKEVLDFCNFIFENTMSKSFGEVNYDKDEKLYLGASFEEGENLDTEVLLIDGMETKENLDDDLSKVQKEAILVSSKIKEMIDSGYKVFDNKKGQKRCIKPSDIVILLRSLKNASFFSEALSKRGISSYLESSLEYFDNYEVKLVINTLKIIDNPYDDVALMSFLASPVINVSLDKIAKLRSTNKSSSLYESVICDDEIKWIMDKIKDVRSFSYNHKLYELLNLVYKEFDVIEILSAMEGGLVRQKNLSLMVSYAKTFDDKNLSLHEFISYLENIILGKGSLEGINPLSDGDNVLITTIHKSKGLEYPVVFVSETGKSFNFSDLRSDLMINDDLGVSFNLKDTKYKLKYESIPNMVFKEYEKNKMLSEEIRILYVALTRAKEKIIITGFTENLERLILKVASKMGDDVLVSDLYLKSCKSYLDMIMPSLLRHPALNELRCLSDVTPKTFITESKVSLKVLGASSINESEFYEKEKIVKEDFNLEWYKKISDFKYDGKGSVPKYLSVSDIKHKTKYQRKPDFLDGKVSSINKGTLYHLLLELLPVKRYTIKSLEEEIDEIIKNGKILESDKKIIRLEDIFSYLTSDIYENLLYSDKYYKEMPINFYIPSSYYDNSLKSGNILSSGVIDLLFITNDTYNIVDYKTDKVSSMDELKDLYKVQLDLYEIALREKMNAKNVKKFIYSIYLGKFIEV